MQKEYRILSINEWRESSAYVYQQWFADKEREIKTYFESESYSELEFDDYDYDSTLVVGIQTALLYFHERDVQYRAEVVVDSDMVQDDIIAEFDILLFAYDMEGNQLGDVRTTVQVDEFGEDALLTLVTELKEKIESGDTTSTASTPTPPPVEEQPVIAETTGEEEVQAQPEV
jgi:hypothetical protein